MSANNPSSLSPQHKKRDRRESIGKVHFADGDTAEHSGEIVVKAVGDGRGAVEAHIGMLSEFHKYDVHIMVPFYVGDQLQVASEHPYLTMAGLKADTQKSRQMFTLCYTAARQGAQVEQIVFRKAAGDADGDTFAIELHVTVIGKGKGTPLLKTGIHCTGVDAALDSTAESSQAEENGDGAGGGGGS